MTMRVAPRPGGFLGQDDGGAYYDNADPASPWYDGADATPYYDNADPASPWYDGAGTGDATGASGTYTYDDENPASPWYGGAGTGDATGASGTYTYDDENPASPWYGGGGVNPSGDPTGGTGVKTVPPMTGGGSSGGDVGGLIGAMGKAISNLFGHKSAPKKATVVAPRPTGILNLTPNTQMLVVVGLIGAAALIAMRSGSGRSRR